MRWRQLNVGTKVSSIRQTQPATRADRSVSSLAPSASEGDRHLVVVPGGGPPDAEVFVQILVGRVAPQPTASAATPPPTALSANRLVHKVLQGQLNHEQGRPQA